MLKKINYKILLSFILGMIVSSVTVYSAANIIAAKKISYNNSQSHLEANNLQEAIDLLYGNATSYQSLKTDMLNTIYPVGSIYLSTSLSTTSQVATTLGGTWVVFGAGKTIVGVNTSETEFNTIEKTGGEKTHTLTVTEMPAHQHNMYYTWSGAGTVGGNWKISMVNTTAGGSGNWPNHTGLTTNVAMAGGSGAHNNLQPYITVYMYKRTA